MDQDSVTVLLPTEYWNNRALAQTRGRKPIIVLAIQTILLFAYTIFTVSFDYIIDTKSNNPIINSSRSSTVIYFSHLAIRLLCFIFKIYLDRCYHRELKIYGYRSHYERTTFLSELTHLLFNKITLLFLLNSSIYQLITVENNDHLIHLFNSGYSITQTQIAKIISVVISTIITILSGKKLHLEIDFQLKNKAPDTISDNEINETRPSSDIGFRSSNLIEELLEKQNELIGSLKAKNERLILLLMNSVNQDTRESSDSE